MPLQQDEAPYDELLTIPVVTVGLVFINVIFFCYLSQWLNGSEIDFAALIHAGANVAPLTLTGEAWRLFSSMFLHSSFPHLSMNMLALLVIGTFTEKILGKWRLLAVYLLSGMFAALVSASYALSEANSVSHHFLITSQTIISVGASGSIMGLAGAVIAMLAFTEPATRTKKAQQTLYSLSGMVVLTLLYGVRQDVDNASHVGGLGAGAAMGYLNSVLGLRKKRLWEVLLLCGVCALLLVGTWLAQRQIDEHVMQTRTELRSQFYPQAVEKERQEKRQVLTEERETHREKLPERVSREEASGTLLAAIPDIQDITLSNDGHTLYAAIEEKNTIAIVDLVHKKAIRTFTAPLRAKNYIDHCSSCSDQGVRSLRLSPDESLLYVTGFEPDALSVIRVATGEIIQTIATGRSPDALVISRDGKRGWVMNRSSNSVSVIDLVSYQTVADIALERYDGAGSSGRGSTWPIALSSDEKTLLLPGMLRGNIVRINTDTQQIVDYPQGDAHGMVSVVGFRSESGDVIYADSLGISRIDQASKKVKLQSQWCSRSIYSVEAISPDGRYIAILSYGLTGYIVLLNVDAGQVVGVYPASHANQIRFSADGKALFVLGASGVIKLDIKKSIAPREIIRHPQYGDVACTPDV